MPWRRAVCYLQQRWQALTADALCSECANLIQCTFEKKTGWNNSTMAIHSSCRQDIFVENSVQHFHGCSNLRCIENAISPTRANTVTCLPKEMPVSLDQGTWSNAPDELTNWRLNCRACQRGSVVLSSHGCQCRACLPCGIRWSVTLQ